MAEIDKVIEEEKVTPDSEEIDIELEGEEPTTVEEAVNETEEFFKNLTEDMSDETLQRMSNQLLDDYKKDRISRKDWETSYTNNLDLLGIKHTEMTRPFKGSASVTHPLLSEAVTSFQAQAYKELLPSQGPVRTRVLGMEDNEKINQAQRVQDFMNYMLTEEMEEYTPEFDQLLFYLALAGSAFKKVYYDEVMQRAVSKFIPAEDLVVPYYTTDLMDCERITHVIKMGENEILKKQAAGFYRDVELKPTAAGPTEIEKKYQELEGVTPSTDKQYSYQILEMHVDLNLEEFEMQNPDKQVKIPYIVTIDEGSGEVLSIYRNYDMNDETKKRKEYFVHFKFLPGLGFYGFGLTHMIGGLSKASISIVRQLIDAGTLANLPAGFKTRGIRIRDEDTPIQPGEFRDVDAPGGSLRDSIQPLPFKEPSGTLLSLLNILVNSGQKFASIAEINTGQGNPNAPVGTTLALLERSTKVLSAIHKRLHNSQKKEFRILSQVFQEYLPQEYPYAVANNETTIKLSDFDQRVDIFPISNPDIFSQSQRIAMAQEMMQLVQSNPQVHGPNVTYEAYKRMYAAIGVDNVEQILTPPPPTDPLPIEAGFENNQLLLGQQAQAFPQQNHDAHIAIHMSLLNTPPVQMNAQVQALIHSHIMQHLQMKADLLGEQQMPPEVMQQFQQLQQQAQQASPEEAQNLSIQAGDILAQFSAPILAELLVEYNQKVAAPQDEDPLVAIRKQELALKGQELSIEQQQFLAAEQRKMQEAQQRMNVDRERIDTQEDIAELRNDTARARMEQQARFKLLDARNKNN